MRVLIADADSASRTLMARLLGRYHNCEVGEVDSGMATLAEVERSRPDVLITESLLPDMTGLELIALLRAHAITRHLAVSVISADHSYHTVRRCVELGVADYLLKPVEVEALRRRLAQMLRDVATRPRPDATQGPATSLLLLDGDPNFRSFARPILERHFRVTEGSSAAAVLSAAREAPPGIVCAGPETGVLHGIGLARLLAAGTLGFACDRFFLAGAPNEPVDPVWNGAVHRTFLPDQFDASVRRIILGERSAPERLTDLVAELDGELFSALQQSVGVMTSLDLRRMDGDPPGADLIAAATPLRTASGTAEVVLALRARPTDAVALAARMIGEELPLDAGGAEAFGEILTSLGGRIRDSLFQRGFATEQGQTEIGGTAVDGIRLAAITDTGLRLWLEAGVRTL
ncbi:MAG: two-component system response regulator [Gemmatimonadales bacterium]